MQRHKQNAGIVEVNIHGMTKYQAKVCIDSKLKKARSDVYRIRVIHGFNNGVELKDMVQSEYKNHEKVIRIESGLNLGITDLVLREL